jgi:hypothetical protein
MRCGIRQPYVISLSILNETLQWVAFFSVTKPVLSQSHYWAANPCGQSGKSGGRSSAGFEPSHFFDVLPRLDDTQHFRGYE